MKTAGAITRGPRYRELAAYHPHLYFTLEGDRAVQGRRHRRGNQG
ncbi:MAG: hypothetical protein ABSH52_08565 [Terriglobia bacterium]|jgi:hypothetical protein